MRRSTSLVIPLLVMLSSEAYAGPTLFVNEASSTMAVGQPRRLEYNFRLEGIDAVRAVMVQVVWPHSDAHALSLSLSPPYAGTRVFRNDGDGSASGLRFAMVFPTLVPAGSEAGAGVLATMRSQPGQHVTARPILTAQMVTRNGRQMDLPVSYTSDASAQPAISATSQLFVSSNPGSGATRVRYVIARRGEVALLVFDSRGRKVRTLSTGFKEAGDYSLSWDERDDVSHSVPQGVYFLRLLTQDAARVHKLIVMR